MSSSTVRMILRAGVSSRKEIKELLAGLLAAELVAPSERLWLVSPWIRDVVLLDNRAGSYRGLGPGWARREISLYDILAELARRGSNVVVVTRPGPDSDRALVPLQRLVGEGPAADRLRFVRPPRLHAKGLLGDDYCLSGSMNFTRNGIEHLDEMITYTTDPAQVGAMRIDFTEEYGGDR